MPKTRIEYLREESLKTDGSKRLPICFCIDTSGSMRARIAGDFVYTGEIIQIDGRKRKVVKGGITALSELQKGIKFFLDQIKKDELALTAAEVAIVTFDDDARTLVDFCRLQDFPYDAIDKIETHDSTYLGEGIELALGKLESCIEENKKYGIDNYAPLLIVMSDGYPSDDKYMLNMLKDRIALFQKNYNLVVVPIGIGDKADLKGLSKLAAGCNATKIYGVEFDKLFEQLTGYVENVSRLIDDSHITPEIMVQGGIRDDNEGVYETFDISPPDEWVKPLLDDELDFALH